ncbi:hypothetical protein CLIB1423_05S02498 [[Candida] railenensis]|uniref:Uncharacterized protein n=1 Tax=[Candida] railenensis TaxID=45579 RepID=A0A9P0VXY9_9ASCO|nr:hypothetical protein CLIB1423_05S02498 [[Candida] railenensis]
MSREAHLNASSSNPKSKRKNSRYSIQWPSDMIQLPSVEMFQLDTIIDEELKNESSEVVNALLEVMSNYKKDLKLEIRRNLSSEQKVQHSNIKVAKLAQSITKKISTRNRKLEKLIHTSDIDSELQDLLQLSGECNGLISNLGPRLVRIHKVKGTSGDGIEKYATINKLWGKQKKSENIDPHAASISKVNVGSNSKENGKKNGRFEVDKAEHEKVVRSAVKTGRGKANGSVVHNPFSSEMDENAFEEFMSSSISKYRDQQSKKERQQFEFPDIIVPDDLSYEAPKTPKTPQTPKTLGERKSAYNTPINSMKLTAKSPATTSSTLQSSHFKKLRINGSPITSKTYSKMKTIPTCDCSDTHEHESVPAGAVSLDENGNEEIGASEYKEPTLQQSLSELSTLILHSDDEYTNSSGLTTDESDVFSTDSSDSDAENGHSIADMYYQSLKSNLRKKKRKSRRDLFKNSISERSDTNGENSRAFKAESPTPKHKPSHHTLKPKKSILKFPKENSSAKAEHSLQSKLVNNLELNLSSSVKIKSRPNGGPLMATVPSVSAVPGRSNPSAGFKFLRPQSSFNPAPRVNNEAALGTMLSIDNELYGDEARHYEEDEEGDLLSDNESDARSVRSIQRLRGLL